MKDNKFKFYIKIFFYSSIFFILLFCFDFIGFDVNNKFIEFRVVSSIPFIVVILLCTISFFFPEAAISIIKKILKLN